MAEQKLIKTTIYLDENLKRKYDNVAILMKKIKSKREMDNEAISQYVNNIIKKYDLGDKLVLLD